MGTVVFAVAKLAPGERERHTQRDFPRGFLGFSFLVEICDFQLQVAVATSRTAHSRRECE